MTRLPERGWPGRAGWPGRSPRLVLVAAAVGWLAACAGDPPARRPNNPLDAEITNAAAAAQAAFARGSCELAASFYGRALQRARAADDAEAIGNYAYNMAVCMIATGELDRAGALLAEAEREFQRAGIPLADALLVQAQLAYHYASRGQAPFSRAALSAVEKAAQRVLTEPRSQPNPEQRAQTALLLAEVACRRGDVEASEGRLGEARQWAGAVPAAGVQAGLARVSGCIDLLRNRTIQAGGHFDEEAERLRAGQRYADMARALRRAAEAYRRAGLSEQAAERYYRAARSWLGQGDKDQAREDLEAADALAGQLRDESLRRLIEELRKGVVE